MKTYFPIQGNQANNQQFEDQLNALITGVSKEVETYLQRHVEIDDYTEIFDIKSVTDNLFQVKGFPINSVSEALNNGTDITENIGIKTRGKLGWFRVKQLLECDYEALEITYNGGMAVDTADFIAKFPDIEKAVIDQVIFEQQRSRNLSVKNQSFSSTDKEYIAMKLLPNVKKIIRFYRKQNYIV